MIRYLSALWSRVSNAGLDLSDAALEEDDRIVLYDRNGHPVRVKVEDINRAIKADIINGAEALHDHLVYEEKWTWPVTIEGIRLIIDIAHNEPDPDMALLTLVTNAGFHEKHGPDKTDDEE